MKLQMQHLHQQQCHIVFFWKQLLISAPIVAPKWTKGPYCPTEPPAEIERIEANELIKPDLISRAFFQNALLILHLEDHAIDRQVQFLLKFQRLNQQRRE